jgi:hypothetical protein
VGTTAVEYEVKIYPNIQKDYEYHYYYYKNWCLVLITGIQILPDYLLQQSSGADFQPVTPNAFSVPQEVQRRHPLRSPKDSSQLTLAAFRFGKHNQHICQGNVGHGFWLQRRFAKCAVTAIRKSLGFITR